MVVSIRLPSESHSPPLHYSYRHRGSKAFYSPRVWRRILPLLLLFILVVESYRFLIAAWWTSDAPSPHLITPPPPLSRLPSPLSDPHYKYDGNLEETYDLGPPLQGVKNLVIVACHAIWLGGASLGEDEAEWTLESFQKGTGSHNTFIRHISKGIQLATADNESLLVFSGGETRRKAGPRMEGGSYFELAVARSLIPSELMLRTTTEVASLDSYQNLLFSILRFREITAQYPEHITIVSYLFKEPRFTNIHRVAVQFPASNFTFVGIDPVFKDADEKLAVEEGERTNARDMWERDPYACFEKGLREKRKRRNAARRIWAYDVSAPEIRHLLRWCETGGASGRWFDGVLPWTTKNTAAADKEAVKGPMDSEKTGPQP